MGKFGKIMATGVVALLVVSLAEGQFQFPGRGGDGGGFQQDPTSLLRNPKVKEELKLTDEQLAKVPEAVMKALSDVLNPGQLKRLKQIELQQKGTQAFKDAKVQTALKFSDDQKERIDTILEDSAKELRGMRDGLKGGDFKGMFEKMSALRKETNEKVQSVLTASQKQQWQDMVGDEIQLTRPGFGFGGAPGTDGKKKFDFRKKTDNK